MQFSVILTLLALAVGSMSPLESEAQTRDQARAQAAQQASADASLLEMGQAFKRGDRKRLVALLPLVAGHPLEPWASYWELRSRLDTATPPEVQDFHTRYAGTYQEDRLRNDWLLLLGQRRDWAAFNAEIANYRMNDDKEVRCYALAADGAAATAETAAEVKRLWYAQRDADDGCLLAASKHYAAKKLNAADIWRKARLSIEANRVKAARAAVEIVAPDAGAEVSELQDNAVKYLSKRVVAGSRVDKELVVLALIRMASNDADITASVLENHWSVHLNPEQLSWAWSAVGKAAAQRLSNEAPGYFAKARGKEMNDEHLAWRVRAALRKGNWKDVRYATQAMSDEARQDPAWVYWHARALTKLAKTEVEQQAATTALQGLASARGFYEQMASEALGQTITVPERPLPLLPEEKQAAAKNPGLMRALYAIQIGLRAEGVREWNYSTNLHGRGGMSDRELLAAADLACQREVWDRCINTSERTKTVVDQEQRFPMPFKDAVVARAKQINLDPAYVYGLIRQESRFIMDARSSVGASGLMQVMPATARWTAKKIGIVDFQAHQINDRDTNIAIGTGYLKLVLDDFAGSMPMAAAAYNAGPGRPRSWRGQPGDPVLEAAIWAENIPFAETRDYVKKVLSNTTNYAALITGQPQSLKSRLGAVGPRDTAAPEVNRELP
jgi:soluble lytic murein transglycosylase